MHLAQASGSPEERFGTCKAILLTKLHDMKTGTASSSEGSSLFSHWNCSVLEMGKVQNN